MSWGRQFQAFGADMRKALSPNFSHKELFYTFPVSSVKVFLICLLNTLTVLVSYKRTDFSKRAFRSSAPTVWNSLPQIVLISDSLSIFKSRLKTFLFTQAFTEHWSDLPPASLKLRPYSTIELLIIIFLPSVNMILREVSKLGNIEKLGMSSNPCSHDLTNRTTLKRCTRLSISETDNWFEGFHQKWQPTSCQGL